MTLNVVIIYGLYVAMIASVVIMLSTHRSTP